VLIMASYLEIHEDSFSSNQQIAVIGANGFIGSAVFRLLNEEKKHVHAFSRKSPINIEDVHFMQQYSHVIWCATGINPLISGTNQEANDIEIAYWGRFLENIIRLREYGHHLKVIFLSSGGCVYPDGNPPFNENDIGIPLNNYGKLKKKMEDMALITNIDVTVLRLANVYGPGQKIGVGQGVIGEWVHRILRDLPVEIFGSLDSVRDFVYIDDAAKAIFHALECKSPRVFNIGGGEPIRLERVLQCISDVTGKIPNLKYSTKRIVDRSSYWLNSDLAHSELGWSPLISLRKGIELTVSYEMGKLV